MRNARKKRSRGNFFADAVGKNPKPGVLGASWSDQREKSDSSGLMEKQKVMVHDEFVYAWGDAGLTISEEGLATPGLFNVAVASSLELRLTRWPSQASATANRGQS